MFKTFASITLTVLVSIFVLSTGLPIMADAAQQDAPAAQMNAADNKLADAVRQALKKADFADESVMVEAKDGVITLTGTVLGKDRVAECEQAARRVDGVKHVVNKLTFPSVQTGGDR